MKLTTTQQAELLEAAKPLIRWMNENCHPHCEVRIDQCDVELFEGIAMARTEEFVDGRRESASDIDRLSARVESQAERIDRLERDLSAAMARDLGRKRACQMLTRQLDEERTRPEVAAALRARVKALEADAVFAANALLDQVKVLHQAKARIRTLEAECLSWRVAWDLRDDAADGYADPYHSHDCEGVDDDGDPCDSCERFIRVRAARAATGQIGGGP